MKVYAVTEFHADYSNSSWALKAVFATKQLAEDYASKLAALPGITGEYGPGSENEYDVEEMDVWDAPIERVMIFHHSAYIDPEGRECNKPNKYRTEEYAPAGYTGYFDEAVNPPDWGAEVRDRGWGRIDVSAPTQEEADTRFEAVLNQHWGHIPQS